MNDWKSGEWMKDVSDADLLAILATGKKEAFWPLWNRHQPHLHRLCLREMHGHAANAEDALSMVMLKALDRLPDNAPKIIHLEAWLHRLAKNLCIDLGREQNRRLKVVEDWRFAVNSASWSPMPGQPGELEIRRRIAALPLPLREPLELHIVREMPVREVAGQLQLSPANVRKRMQLACEQLRRDIAGSHAGDGKPQPSEKHSPGATPARPPQRQSNKPVELFSSVAFIRTVRVKLPCGVEQLFHVYPSKAPFGL